MIRIGLMSIILLSGALSARADDWQKAHWPYGHDGWPAGLALQCSSGQCRNDQLILTRVKFGFCNCETGVRDDAEVDYVADVDLIDAQFTPIENGQSVTLFGLRGRQRLYDYQQGDQHKIALGIALSRSCDVIAISVNNLASPAQARDVIALIKQSPDITSYLSEKLGEKITNP
jgi:hypothetical protein